MGNRGVLASSGVVRPHWSDLAGQGPGDSLARLGLGARHHHGRAGGVRSGRGPGSQSQQRGRAVAAPGYSRCFFKDRFGEGMIYDVPNSELGVGGHRRQKTERLCVGEAG